MLLILCLYLTLLMRLAASLSTPDETTCPGGVDWVMFDESMVAVDNGQDGRFYCIYSQTPGMERCKPAASDCLAVANAIGKYKGDLNINYQGGAVGNRAPLQIVNCSEEDNPGVLQTTFGTCICNLFLDQVPTDGQATHWRIPASMLKDAITYAMTADDSCNSATNLREVPLWNAQVDNSQKLNALDLAPVKVALWYDPSYTDCHSDCGAEPDYCLALGPARLR